MAVMPPKQQDLKGVPNRRLLEAYANAEVWVQASETRKQALAWMGHRERLELELLKRMK